MSRERILNQKDLIYGVTILVPTYDHEEYIEECLKSILMQETNFPFFIVVYVDLSENKKTAEIVNKFKNKYPEKIVVFENKVRLYGGIASIRFHKFSIKTKYWCTLEGDDYWSSPKKLSTQVDILNKNPKAVGTCCQYQELRGKEMSLPKGPTLNIYNMLGKRKNINIYPCYPHTSSILWRNIVEFEKTPFPKKFLNLYGDVSLEIVMLGTNGLMICTKESMSVYRITGKGKWSKFSKKEQEAMNEKLNIMWNKTLSKPIKISLFLLSMKITAIFYYFLSSLRFLPKTIAEIY